ALSAAPAAAARPSGDQATARAPAACPVRVARSFRPSTSHSLTARSSLPVASVLPSGLNASEVTSPAWGFQWAHSLPVSGSQSVTSPWRYFCVRSSNFPPPAARVLPSGAKATADTGPEPAGGGGRSPPAAAGRRLAAPRGRPRRG